MADIPSEQTNEAPKETIIKVTPENAPALTVHYLVQIYGRLGYIVKLLEKQSASKGKK